MIVKRAVAATLIFCGVGTLIILFVGFKYGNNGASQTVIPGANPLSGLTDKNGAVGLENQAGQGSDGTTGSTGASTQPGATSSPGSTAGGSSGGSSTSSGTSKPSTSGSSTINSFTASPASVSYGAASTLSWSTSNVSSCSISPTIGAVGASGTKSTGGLTSSVTYTITCGSVAKSVAVSVGPAPIACGSAGGTCTSAQVATHNSLSNCWVTYNGYYYIVTSYIPKHNGGQSVFNGACGNDISPYMNGSAGSNRHPHSPTAYNTLNSYRVGPVQG